MEALIAIGFSIILILMVSIPQRKELDKLQEEINRLKQVIKDYRDKKSL